jgi:phytoene dehydrogenase-like protein
LHERIFKELRAPVPEAREVVPAYAVRLEDGTDVTLGGGSFEAFEETLRAAFPECADQGATFYREARAVGDAVRRAASRAPALLTLSRFELLKLTAREPRLAPRVIGAASHTAGTHLGVVSARFRRFVDAQLSAFAQCTAEECSYLYAAVALTEPFRGAHAIRGGAQSLADALAASVKACGGTVRLNSSVLRLACDAGGRASGVELLNGERVEARRAVVSNLTVWDTYGKLVGHARTPAEVSARVKRLRGRGAYLLFMGMDEERAARLPAGHVIALTAAPEGADFDPETSVFTFGSAPAWDARAPAGRRAVTVTTWTDAESWFSFHEDEEEHERQDRAALEELWGRLHAAMPELGAGVEVVETLTPRGFYEATRRRLGTVGGLAQTPSMFGPGAHAHRSPVPGLFLVGDTVFPGQRVAAVTHSALVAANEIAPPR